MDRRLLILRLAEVPDPADPALYLGARGDVKAAARVDTEHLLRTLAGFESGSVSLVIRFVFDPASAGRDPQQRLAIYLLAGARDDEAADSLAALLNNGPLQRLFSLERIEIIPVDPPHLVAVCDVVRRQSILDPTVSPEFNTKVLPTYWTINSFEATPENDCLLLDSVLDGIGGPAVIEICVEPADVTRLLADHTAYLADLQQINQTWDTEDAELPHLNWVGCGNDSRSIGKPMQRKDLLVDEVLRRQRRFHESLTQPHLRFHIRAFAQTKQIARLLASVVAEGAFEKGSYQLFDWVKKADCAGETGDSSGRPVKVLTIPTLQKVSEGRRTGRYEDLSSLVHVATVDELVGAFHLPVASQASPRCIRKNTDPPQTDPSDLIILGYDEQSIADNDSITNGIPRGIAVKNLPKHMAVFGLPGTGKTIKGIDLVFQLSARGIACLVFEPKRLAEYRRLKCAKDHADPSLRRLAQDLRIYTPGNSISPLRFNPLFIPEGISRDEHIENMMACFRGAVPMGGPLPALLAEAMEWAYDEHPDPLRPPRMIDLHEAAQRVLTAKGYSAEVNSDLRGALDVRLGVLTRRTIGRVFQCERDIPSIERLMEGTSIIEVGDLPPEQASLLVLFLLTAIAERIGTTSRTGTGPSRVIMLEEAHNIVGRNTDASPSEENADPKGYASAYVCRMLAEMRSSGTGMIILDQLPSAIAPEVTKNTATKLSTRLTDLEDREVLVGATAAGPVEMDELVRLQPGQAYLHTEGYFRPRRIRTPNLEADWNLPPPPVGKAILPYLCGDPWFVEAANERTAMELNHLRESMDRLDETRDRILARISQLLMVHSRALGDRPSTQRSSLLAELAQEARDLRHAMESAFRSFRRDSYEPLMSAPPPAGVVSAHLAALRCQLVERFESVSNPTVQACVRVLDRLIHGSGPDAFTTKGGNEHGAT
jgi:hypothetical protein